MVSVTHSTVVAVPDDGTSPVGSDEWNAGHSLSMATARILGRTTAGTGTIEELTGTQTTAMLDAVTSSLKGLAPASGGGTTNFLRADATWAAPPGGGGITIGTTTITSGATGAFLYDNAGVVGERTAAQATAALNLFSSSLQGLVPSSGGGTTNFLRADGNWAAAGGGGTPGGSNTQVQYNNSSAFGGITNLTSDGTNVTALRMGSTISHDWDNGSGTADVKLFRDAAAILAQRNSTTAQTFRCYNTYTDASNYERAVLDWTTTANTLTFGTQALGTGTQRAMAISSLNFTVSAAGQTTWAQGMISLVDDGRFTIGVYNGGAIFIDARTAASNIIGGSGSAIGFSSSASAAGAAPDTAMSRSAAAVVAFGNGTAGDASACIKAKTKAGAPTTSDVPAGTWALIRDTSGATTKLYYNNAGTLMTVALT